MGCPDYLVDGFRLFRRSWSMVYMNKYGRSTLQGHEKQFSGNPFTICENTLGNMALCHAIFDYKNIKFSLFKGDDSAVACDRCELTPKAQAILAITGHGLKLHNSPIGEFAGWFMTDSGIFPDVLRYTAKFLDKNYRDEDHFNEALMSLRERCRAVKTQHQIVYGSQACALYYREKLDTSITSEQIQILFDFIANSRNLSFSDCYYTTIPITHVD